MTTLDPKKVIVAMSGGVDSSVAALLLKQEGHDVVGVTMRLYSIEEKDLPTYYKGCCSLDDVEDARRVCEMLGVPHYVFNVQREFQAHVIDYFLSEYHRGRTPHPCIACNDRIKFSFLMQRAHYLGAKYVATGHYARIDNRPDGYHLLKAADSSKDQSYVLYGMGQEQLASTLMPVGWLPKPEIRQLAVEAGFPNAAKPDSQEICFIPLGDYRKFLQDRISTKPGRLVDTQGQVLGEHRGIEFFTIGQRKGLGVTSTQPLFVTAIDPDSGDVTLGPESELMQTELWAEQVNYISGQAPAAGTEVAVKIRYKSQETPARLYPQAGGLMVRFDQPQRAVTPGQAVVFYQGDEVIGGGRIGRLQSREAQQPSAAYAVP
jgi:tRNA-specific 2-thiouridylase